MYIYIYILIYICIFSNILYDPYVELAFGPAVSAGRGTGYVDPQWLMATLPAGTNFDKSTADTKKSCRSLSTLYTGNYGIVVY